MHIRLGHRLSMLRSTLHNGPGWRVGLWTQGCVHRCTKDCLNPDFLDPSGGFIFLVENVIAEVLAAVREAPHPVEGVTVLGGEPFEQAAAVRAMLQPLRQLGLSAMVYSGHTLEGVRQRSDFEINALLAEIDLLVDGPFLPEFRNETIAWRGSSNQRLICLTDRYTPAALEAAFARQRKGFSLHLTESHISISGLQDRDAANEVDSLLRRGRFEAEGD